MSMPDTGAVIGIDPGSRRCGFGVLSRDGSYLASGTIVLSENGPLPERLRELHDELVSVIGEHGPSVAAVERVFFARSVKSALTLGEARGVVLMAASSMGLDVREYSATEVKKSVTGYGRAEKSQVQEMVRRVLGLDHGLSPDGADALAIAICHMNMTKLEELKK